MSESMPPDLRLRFGLLTTAEAAVLAHVSTDAIRQWVRRGLLEPVDPAMVTAFRRAGFFARGHRGHLFFRNEVIDAEAGTHDRARRGDVPGQLQGVVMAVERGVMTSEAKDKLRSLGLSAEQIECLAKGDPKYRDNYDVDYDYDYDYD